MEEFKIKLCNIFVKSCRWLDFVGLITTFPTNSKTKVLILIAYNRSAKKQWNKLAMEDLNYEYLFI